jgi:L-Ala-D/L-Glu epimerase
MHMTIHFEFFDLSLRYTFTISRESHDIQPTMIVRLERDGIYGLGECSANPFYQMTRDRFEAVMNRTRATIEKLSWNRPEELYTKLMSILPDDPFVRCAIDIAAWDWYAKSLQKPLYEVWGLKWENIPLTNFTIGLDTKEVMRSKMLEMPWPIYKIKLGTHDDVSIIQYLRKHTNAVFRVDANCAWNAEQAASLSFALKELNVEFLEQPVKAYDFIEAEKLYKTSALPIIADESCQVEEDVRRCKGNFHGINIKLVKCGGLTPALRMIQEAKSYQMKVMVGCMTESSVGISAIAHLLPLLDYVDMDGALLLSKDIATGVVITDGLCAQPDKPGTGAEML